MGAGTHREEPRKNHREEPKESSKTSKKCFTFLVRLMGPYS